MRMTTFPRITLAVGLIAGVMVLPRGLAAQSSVIHTANVQAVAPIDPTHNSLAGNYLAARAANLQRDAAAAAAYFRAVEDEVIGPGAN